jgi:phosphomannomutase
LVDVEAVKAAKFKVVDGVNSSGGIIIPKLLELMGVEVEHVNPTDIFHTIRAFAY